MGEAPSFDEAAAVTVEHDSADLATGTASIHRDWMQGRTSFGAMPVALGVNLVTQMQSLGDHAVRTIAVTFIGPISRGAVEVRARVLRRGGNVIPVEVDVVQADTVATRLTVVLVRGRRAALAVQPPQPARGTVAAATELPFLPGLTPEFTKHMSLRFEDARFPFTGQAHGVVSGYCRHRAPATGLGALAALIDSWPPPALVMLTAPSPSSTVTWTIHVLDPSPAIPVAASSVRSPSDPVDDSDDASGGAAEAGQDDGSGWMYVANRVVQAQDGYVTTVSEAWIGDRMVAWSEQLVAVFER